MKSNIRQRASRKIKHTPIERGTRGRSNPPIKREGKTQSERERKRERDRETKTKRNRKREKREKKELKKEE